MELPLFKICFKCGKGGVFKRAKSFVGDDRLEEALDILLRHCECKPLHEFENELIALRRRLNALNREGRSGCLYYSDFDTMKNQITRDLLSCLGCIEAKTASF